MEKLKRCGDFDGCTVPDCGKCNYCHDRPKLGGNGLLKQCCIQRRCKMIELADQSMTLAVFDDRMLFNPVVIDRTNFVFD